MRSAKHALVGTLGTALALAGLTTVASPAGANPGGSGLVISEVYGAGGNAGAAYNADFVELYNPTASAVPLAGTYLHYRSAAGGSGGAPYALTGSIPARGHWLVRMSAVGTTGAALPAPDQEAGTFSMAAAGGQVFLLSQSTAVTTTGNMAGVPGVIDMVGASGSTSFETAVTGSAATTTSSLNRTATGADTDSNSADFALAAPSPTPSASTPTDPGPSGPPTDATIAEIQGSGATSPLAGKDVVARGAVTAAYPTGGFNGFYLQAPGADTTPGASDGVFVYGPTFDESTLAIGDSVEVTGAVSEFNGLTEVTATTVADVAPLGEVVPNTVIPGTGCALPGTGCLSGAALDAAREEVEGEVFQPSGDFTVTDVYDGSASNPPAASSSSFVGEIGLAARSSEPLIAPTEVIDAQATADIAARTAYNNAHRVVLDDGSTTTYWNTSNTAAGKDTPFPWFTHDNQVRVGAAATFKQPVVLDWRFGSWKVQPVKQVTDAGTDVVSFDQDRPVAPANVGGDLRLATFNVLNYFTTLGADVSGCTAFVDRANNPVAVNSCPGTGPRGAWDQTSFHRQQTKIVHAIDALDADIVSVEEIENSLVVDGHDRDEALAALVDALNAATGAGTWAYVHSPAEASDPVNVAEQDVIRTGFIYKPGKVEPVGEADMLFGTSAFANAREPFAQVFKPAGGAADSAFAVIVNHFKSKGSGTDDGTGQGNANPDRVAQANAVATFADEFAQARGVKAVFMTGDFNAYSQEDPLQVLHDRGYTAVEGQGGKHSYSFEGMSGSLDHVLANAAAKELVSGSDIWEINANETVFNQYSRYNYNARNLYDEGPAGASDHNPEIVGIDTVDATGPKDIQILGTNDFHGRLLADGANAAGAAVLSGAVKQLRGENPDTVFAAAGDLIGASTFESFIQKDEPTIDALNEAGLEVSAAGNHEFDQGYEDLVGRVQGRAKWKYIAANVQEPEGRDDLAETWTKSFGDVQVGFVGAVTEELPSLVAPAGIQGVTVTDIVDATNAAAAKLRADGADIVVLLVHEGASTTDCTSPDFTDPGTVWGNITQNVSPAVDAIVSGHTHLAYNCSFPVKDWAGRAVTERPVVSAGQYGTNLNKLVFTYDQAAGGVVAKSQSILPLTGSTYPADPAVTSIVDAAKTQADVLGARVLGQVAAPFNRAKLSTGAENRGGESTLGNLVAEVQRWATRNPESGSARIAFMNPGGLRADMAGTPNGSARDVTYKQAAVVQPFANTLVNMDLTGAQIKTVLEQQWQRDKDGKVPSRPFLRLGVSKGFTYTYKEKPVTAPGQTAGSTVDTFSGEVTGMWLDGEPIDPAATYSVTVNSFLASGGDNFRELANGRGKADTGKVDLQAMVDYLAAKTASAPLPVDYSQRAVGVTGTAGSYLPGGQVSFDVSSWTMSTPDDKKDAAIQVRLGDQVLGSVPVDNSIGTDGHDQYGRAHVDVALPVDAAPGATELTLVGETTGTEVRVPVTVAKAASTVTVTDVRFHPAKALVVPVQVTAAGGVVPTGTVTLSWQGRVLGTKTLGPDGTARVTIPGKSLPASGAPFTITASYSGDARVLPGEGVGHLTKK